MHIQGWGCARFRLGSRKHFTLGSATRGEHGEQCDDERASHVEQVRAASRTTRNHASTIVVHVHRVNASA